jgi:hypothetical protein
MIGRVLGSFAVVLGRVFIKRNAGYVPGARLVVVTKRKIPVVVYPESNPNHLAHNQSL